nr:hypothetical protein GCM10025699_67560 [Microbacterium flavescens]
MAARIRERAEADGVPLVQDVPLTRALHASCGLGDEIPVDLYTPVARVLTFVMALRARGSSAVTGTHVNPRPTTPDEVAAVLAPGSLEAEAVPQRLRTARDPDSRPAPPGQLAPARPAPRPSATGGTA